MCRLIFRVKKSNVITFVGLSYVVMVKLMKKKAKAEEDAKQCEGGLGKTNCELIEIRIDLKIGRQKLQKATAELKSIGNYSTMSKSRMSCLLYFLFSREWRD
jgi:hypothetical protein